ncbi:TIGR00645 family protein [Primorskyibacter aestuariivivens]|uniref:TIGR00645 family protein n=1 Tax=Primorskyibacter aestuariivivens TaxID=1888912 RepID=UPI0023000361|nr:TIGR00645 family protein [Primorskyibacter aestuariivivens]MDA7428237.1 TIGR00645 family protein [Primorskyibacter aestuariivivens]
MSQDNSLQTRFEKTLFASRWMMAPMYLGLSLSLAMLVVVFVRELFYYLPQVLVMSADKSILAVLTLIDLTLAANLLVIVLFSGYENFVSKLNIGETEDRAAWMGTVDFGGLKMKLIASIIAISGIHLLKRFMEIGQANADKVFGDRELMWLVVIHMVFVLSGVFMALMDWLSAKARKAK